MIIEITKTCLSVKRTWADPKYYGVAGAKGESHLLYAIVKVLEKLGYDVIKKRMAKDGHLVDDLQQYIRARDGSWCAYNDHWAINGLETDFNNDEAILRIEGDIPIL